MGQGLWTLQAEEEEAGAEIRCRPVGTVDVHACGTVSREKPCVERFKQNMSHVRASGEEEKSVLTQHQLQLMYRYRETICTANKTNVIHYFMTCLFIAPSTAQGHHLRAQTHTHKTAKRIGGHVLSGFESERIPDISLVDTKPWIECCWCHCSVFPDCKLAQLMVSIA